MLEFAIPMALMVLGLLLLTCGAEALVEGSLKLATRMGLSPLVAGLTIVAFGTSCPELGVSVSAAMKGVPDVAIGNVLGSNIANALLILGIGALIRPFTAHMALVRIEIPLLFSINLIALLMAVNGEISRSYGLMGPLMFVAYIFYLYRSRTNPAYCLNEGDCTKRAKNGGGKSLLFETSLAALGLVALVYGSETFLKGALRLGQLMGVPELFIGLTFAAVGTSLPEIAATVSAARRGTGDVIMGNVIGSNLANLCLVLGLTSLVRPIPIDGIVLIRDFPVAIFSTLVLLFMVVKKRPITRWQGLALLVAYALYIAFISG